MQGWKWRRPTLRTHARPRRWPFVVRWGPTCALVLLCAGSLELQASPGDYGEDAGPAMRALITGHVGRFLEEQPLMGSFAILARAPFALVAHLAGGNDVAVYDAGVLACVLALSAFTLLLVRRSATSPNHLLLVVVLAMLTPATRAAVTAGHPEEILGAVLCVAAVLLARGRALWAGVLLGLAVSTKQWAFLAVIPVIAAAPRGRRLFAGVAAAAVGALLTLPLVAGNPAAFAHTSTEAATSPTTVGRASVWFLLAVPRRLPLHLGPGFPASVTSYHLVGWLAQLTHPLIIVLLPLLAVVLWRRGCDPLAILALLLLERCVLDPVDNEYYHAPFLLALLAYEVISRRRAIPVLTLVSWCGLWVTFDMLDVHGAAPSLTNAVYLLWTTPVAIALLVQATPRPLGRRGWLRTTDRRGPTLSASGSLSLSSAVDEQPVERPEQTARAARHTR